MGYSEAGFILVLFTSLATFCSSIGPVLSANFPDPSILRASGHYYGFATRTPQIHVQVAEAADFTSWKLYRDYDAMPELPEWVFPELPEIWSPDVSQVADGSFVVYFAAASELQILPNTPRRQHCIGAALSKHVLGPYNPLPKPLACDLEAGGAIDPDGFHDPVSGNRYLIYKVDGNSLGRNHSCHKYVAPTPIMLQQVREDGISAVGEPVGLLSNTRRDGPCIEAPTLLYHEGKYYLIYSSRCFAFETYTVHYAVSSDGISGPYRKIPRPLLITTQRINGVELHAPGGVDVDSSNSSRIVFHSDTNLDWFALETFDPAGRVRAMFAAELNFGQHGFLIAKTLA